MNLGEDRDRIELVQRQAEKWAHELIDLGPRNTLLRYRDTKTTTLDLSRAEQAALSRLLSGGRTRLSALLPHEETRAEACQRARSLRRRMVELEEEQGVEAGRLAYGLFRLPAPPTRGTTPLPDLRAPLILWPIALEARTAAENDYTLELVGEPEVNPVLVYSLDQHYGVDLDTERTVDELNALLAEAEHPEKAVSQIYETLAQLVAGNGRVAEFEKRVVVGIFSFEKFPMIKDLKQSTGLLASHDVIAAAAGYVPARELLRESAANYRPTKPDDIPPKDEFLVLDADSSQQQAIAAVLDGQHVVIQGPPGTGKSQTIANIIAAAAAQGKRVLFVAEKRAAIEAVTERLEQVDLGHLVFDLHQRKFNKKQVAQQVAESLERADRELPPQTGNLHDRLENLRRQVIQHDEELHDPRKPWGLSPFQVYKELLALPESSRTDIRFRRPVLQELAGKAFQEAEDALVRFVNTGGLRFRRGESVWSGSPIRDMQQVDEVLTKLDELAGRTWRTAQQEMRGLVSSAGLCQPTDLAGWQDVLSLLREVEDTLTRYKPEVFGPDLDDLRLATGDRRWRARQDRTLGWWHRFRLRRKARSLRTVGRCDRRTLHEELSAAVQQRNRWRELAVAEGGAPTQVVGLAEVVQHVAKVRDQLAAVAAGAQLQEPERWPEDKVTAKLNELQSQRDELFQVPTLNQLTDRLEAWGLGPLLDELARRDADATQARMLLHFAWYSSLLDEFRLRSPYLAQFRGQHQDHVVAEFQQRDIEHLRLNAARVRRRVAERLQQVRDAHPEQNEVVQGEAKRKRGHMPLRKFVSKASDVLLAARPCWAMSPIVVSRLLPAERLFDLVIFDEASQVEPYDAMTSIMRGSQLVVAGDSKQLPPSPFFHKALAGTGQDEEEDGEPVSTAQVGDFESILTCLAAFVPTTFMLTWHYRSQDERLIAVANREVYGGRLETFPGCQVSSPLTLHLVDGRVGPGERGVAREEVQRIVELILDHVRNHPDDTLGVITLGSSSVAPIETAIRRASQQHPELEEFLARMQGPGRRLFVKNLERVQGDERDAIILSLGGAKGANGRFDMRVLGPLNQEGGERRLNVAITRARRRMDVVSCFSAEDMRPDHARKGPDLLRQFLEFARNGCDLERVGRPTGTELNGFESSVYDALCRAGIPVTPQWGVAGYRIDFALAHPDKPGRMVLAVEADGDTYHRAESARDRDRLRQEHLERLGWRFHRLWASEWFHDPEGQTQLVWQRWQEAVEEVNREAELRANADTQAAVEKEGNGRNERLAEESVAQQIAVDRGPRPAFLSQPRRAKIDDYTDDELIELFLWLLRDQLALVREDRINQAIEVLGFQRRTSKMKERLGRVLARAQELKAEGGR